jgi:type II secretory pathway component GspD/PulD (secretin)
MINMRSMEMAKLPPAKLSPILALSALLFIVVAAVSFWAGRQSRPSSSMSTGGGERTLQVSIEARDVDVTEVLRSFARQVGAELAIDSSIHGNISIKAENSNLTEVMNDLCLVHQCQWTLSKKADLLTVTKRPHT